MKLPSTFSVPRIVLVSLTAALLTVGATHRCYGGAATPRLFILDSKILATAKNRLQLNDPTIAPAVEKLIREADRALSHEAFSVVQKDFTPPSGDKHDYMSIAPYWWPNPDTVTALPYVRRDGEINPERDLSSDRKKMDSMIQEVRTLALGFFFTGRERYAAKAAKLVRVWFLNPPTKMNPNLRYAQAIAGVNQGRAAGIIETHNLPGLIDDVGLLNGSKSWNRSDQRALQDWFDAYLTWLLQSPEGQTEAKAENNHGNWYDVQVASYASFAGKDELARKVLNEFSTQRIAKQIAPDGSQPRELLRAQAWDYSLFNLEALFDAASIADKLAEDLWNYETPDKRGMRRALDWFLPFAIGVKKWSYQQPTARRLEKFASFLRRAAERYREPVYEKAIEKLPGTFTDQRWQLLYPKTLLEQ